MALFSPYKHGIGKFEGYDIQKLGNQFRNLEILESREGEPNINIGLNFITKAGTFREMPPVKDMNDNMYKYAHDMENGRSTYIKNNGIWQRREQK